MEILDWEKARFWSLVHIKDENSCWEFAPKARVTGYGSLSFRGKPWLAHRLAWTLTNGPIPQSAGHHGTVVMHTCDNRLCVNPNHLRIGSQRDNVHGMVDKGRKVNGPSFGSKHANSKFTEADVIAIRQSSESDPVLAARYGVTPEAINYARTRGWRHVEARPVPWVSGKSDATRGDKNPNAKLNAEIVREIRASADKPGILAKKYGILPDYVTMIRKRKAWKHVE